MCIDYALRPRLSSRLTLGGRTFPRKPQIFDHYDSHIILVTHSGILSRTSSTPASADASPYCTTLPYPTLMRCPCFGLCLAIQFDCRYFRALFFPCLLFLSEIIVCRFDKQRQKIYTFLSLVLVEILNSLSFGYMLSPVKFSAHSHSTSELLRTLLMCGCF